MSSHLISAANRRAFLKQAGAVALAAASSPLLGAVPTAAQKTPETLVKLLYDSLSDPQKSQVCFPWNHVDKSRGLLRTRLENNWKITEPSIKGSFYTADQQHLIRKIFEGMTSPGSTDSSGMTSAASVRTSRSPFSAGPAPTSSSSSSPAGT
jgi:hypothetical protein